MTTTRPTTENPRWGIATAPTGRQYFGQIRRLEFDPIAGGAFVEMKPGYSYELQISEDKRSLVRNVQHVDGIVEASEIHTFATTIVYVDEGPDLTAILAMVDRYRAMFELQRNRFQMQQDAKEPGRES